MTAARETRQWYLVRANAQPVACYQCGRDLYALRVRYRRIMVDCVAEGGTAPTGDTDGRGVNHAGHCRPQRQPPDPFMQPEARISRTTP